MFSHSRGLALLCSSLLLIISGCHSSLRTIEAPVSWQAQSRLLHAQKYWNLHGAISIRQTARYNLFHFSWQQQATKFQIHLTAPMNLTSANISGDQQQVSFCQLGHSCVQANSAEQLFLRQVGWYLPISYLRYWILALPAPTVSSQQQFDHTGCLIQLTQAGWIIKFLAYQYNRLKSLRLPTVLRLENSKLTIKIKINQLAFE